MVTARDYLGNAAWSGGLLLGDRAVTRAAARDKKAPAKIPRLS
jgi:hypothetical protein